MRGTRIRVREDGEMDTLTFVMVILEAVVECAKIVAVFVGLSVVFGFIKIAPSKLRNLAPRLAATAFILTVVGTNLSQYFILMTLCWSRLSTVVLVLSGSVTMLLLMFTVILVTAMLGYRPRRLRTDFSRNAFVQGKGSIFCLIGKLSNSYLATTPVLLS